MKVLLVTTETGRQYLLDPRGFWARLPRNKNSWYDWQRVYVLMSGDTLVRTPMPGEGNWEYVKRPVIGKHMFISSRDEWWTSTKVISLEEIDLDSTSQMR